MKEAELAKRLAAGDRTAFDELYELYKDQAFRTAWFLSGNRADAEDIVQDTFVKVYLNIRQLKDEKGFKSWFYRILTRTAWKLSEGKKREVPDDEILDHADSLSEHFEDLTPERLLKEEERSIIKAAVDSLDEKHRTVLILYYYNEFSTKTIAQILGCLEGTVKSRLFTARRKIKTELLCKSGREGIVCAQRNGRKIKGVF